MHQFELGQRSAGRHPFRYYRECDAPDVYKQAYIERRKKEDIHHYPEPGRMPDGLV